MSAVEGVGQTRHKRNGQHPIHRCIVDLPKVSVLKSTKPSMMAELLVAVLKLAGNPVIFICLRALACGLVHSQK
jgi:hypothetical protein